MKKYIYISIISSLLIGSSCKKMDRFPLDGPATGAFPATEQEALMGLFGAYQQISKMDAAATPIWHVMDNITDIGYARPSANYTPPITSAIVTDNALVVKPWSIYYKAIARVHSVLDNLSNLKSSMSDASYKQVDAELRFVRAFCYSQLIELYGAVPLITHAVDLSNADVPRTPKNEIQEFLIAELGEIAPHLPVSQAQFGNTRASRVAALMLKARIELYSKKYEAAAQTAKAAIDLNVHDLTPFNNTITLAGKDHTLGEPDIANIYGHDGFKNSKEWIWVLEYNNAIPGNTHNQQYNAASRLANGTAYWGPTQDLINTFQAIDGLPITESPLYDPAKPFENRDPRLDMYAVRQGARFLGFEFDPAKPTVRNYWPVLNGQSSTPAIVENADAVNAFRSFSGYLWRKTVDIADYNSTSVNGTSDLNAGVFRFAELLLIYAEAKIEANDIDNSVREAINRIRRRAHMPDLPASLTQAQMRKALRYERKIELANDGLRWYDLRRWGIAKDIMNGVLYLNRDAKPWSADVLIGFDDNYTPIYNHTEALKYFTTQEVVYKENKDEYWPVPRSEIQANKNLTQNPGY